MQELYNKLIAKIDKKQVVLNEPMKKHTTFKIRRTGRYFCKSK